MDVNSISLVWKCADIHLSKTALYPYPSRYDTVGKPSIINIFPQIVGYGEQFQIKYTGVVDPNVQVPGHICDQGHDLIISK